MVREMSLQEVLQGIVALVVEFTACDSCLIYLIDNDELALCASNMPHASEIGKIRLKLGEGLTGWVAKERRLVAISRKRTRTRGSKHSATFPKTPSRRFSRRR